MSGRELPHALRSARRGEAVRGLAGLGGEVGSAEGFVNIQTRSRMGVAKAEVMSRRRSGPGAVAAAASKARRRSVTTRQSDSSGAITRRNGVGARGWMTRAVRASMLQFCRATRSEEAGARRRDGVVVLDWRAAALSHQPHRVVAEKPSSGAAGSGRGGAAFAVTCGFTSAEVEWWSREAGQR